MTRRVPSSFACTAVVLGLVLMTLAGPAAASKKDADNPNPELFAQDARPYGKDMATWGERATQWVYGTPLDRNPLFDDTGANCDVDQQGKVWFLARIAGPPVFEGTRHCTIPHQKAVLLYIGAVTAAYPCASDPSYQPAPGQSLYDFLAADAAFYMNTVDRLEVSIDGRPMQDVFDYRYVSDDLFSLTGHPSLREVYDSCITGEPQDAVVDGFFMMLKPLDRGEHTIRVYGTNTYGHEKTFNYYLTVV